MSRHRAILGIVILLFILCGEIERSMCAETMQLVVDGQPRTYLLERPQAQGPSPTLVVLHGLGGTAQRIAQQTHLPELAPRDGFAVAFPQARAIVWNRFSRGTESPQAHETFRPVGGPPDDIGFLKMLVADLVQRGVSDPGRIYLAGFSNGGFMTLSMFCFGEGTFAAIGLMISSMTEATGDDCRPAKPLPVVMLNGTADTVVPYRGGKVSNGSFSVWSTDRLIAFFRRLNGCSGRAETAELPGQSAERIEVERFTGCAGGPVVAYKVLDGTHASTLSAVNTGRMLLDFFRDPARSVASMQVAAAAQSDVVPLPPLQLGTPAQPNIAPLPPVQVGPPPAPRVVPLPPPVLPSVPPAPGPSDRRAEDEALCFRGAVGQENIAACSRLIAPGALQGAELARAYVRRGFLHGRRGEGDDHTRAVADANDALRLEPNNPQALAIRAAGYVRLDDLDRALADLNEGYRIAPHDDGIRNGFGSYFYAKGQNDRALATFNEALRLNPDNSSIYGNRALAYERAGEHDRRSPIFARRSDAIRRKEKQWDARPRRESSAWRNSWPHCTRGRRRSPPSRRRPRPLYRPRRR